MKPDQDNYYWLFSSSAQTISAFVAFLVTGFALVLNMLDTLQQKDETLEDIHIKLKSDYYKKIRVLAVITGLAIVLSLWMVYLNGGDSEHKGWLFSVTAILNGIAIFVGILFVMSIINPDKYKKAAKEIIKEDKMEASTENNNIDQATFMTEFIRLEKSIREKLQGNQLYVAYGDTPKMAYSFRQMVDALYKNELINPNEREELLQINKYRNLVFHGHQDKVDKGMLERVKNAHAVIDKIKVKMNMEKTLKTLRKGERALVHITPNQEEQFAVINGIDYNLDTLQIKYNEKYANSQITVAYFDANGTKISYPVTLDKNGFKSWMNDEPVENPNFGFIGFTSKQEVIFDFSFN